MATLPQGRSGASTRDRFDDASQDDADRAGVGGINLRSLAVTLRANAPLIGLVMAGALIVAVILTLLQTPRYTALTTVQINAQADQVLGQTQDQQDVSSFYDQDRFLQTQLDILQSRGLSERVAQRLKLQNDPRFYRAVGAKPPGPDTPAKASQDGTVAALRNGLSVDLPRSSRVASIRFTSTDAELSARIANTFAEEFIASNLQRKFDSSAYARSFVAQQLAQAKSRLERSEVALNGYARQNGLIRTRDPAADGDKGPAGGSITTASLLQINEAANTARAQRIAAQGRWQAVSGNAALSSPDVLGNPAVQQLLGQRADVQAKLQQERVRHLDGYPTVVQLRAQAGEIERQLGALVGAVRASVRSQYEAAETSERQLADQVATLKTATLSEQDRSVQYNLLAREADTNRTIFDGLLQRFKELNAAAGISASNLLIIDRADTPGQPSSPSLFRNLALALATGMIISAALVLIRDQFDDSIRVPEDIEAKLGLPLLGVVPRVTAAGSDLADPKSAMSEAYASLGGALLYATGEGLPETLLVTSAQASEGKSITSLAIAGNLARIGKQVVLIDLDLRRPSLARNIGGDNARGMTGLLTGQDTVDGVLMRTEQERLSVITAGPLPPSPAELIAGPRLQAVIDDLAARFDVVVIDSPPVLGLADAPLLSALVDGVVIVVEAGRSRRGALKASLRRLRAMRPILVGAVLTKFDPRKGANRYSDYYGSAYYGEDGPGSGRVRA